MMGIRSATKVGASLQRTENWGGIAPEQACRQATPWLRDAVEIALTQPNILLLCLKVLRYNLSSPTGGSHADLRVSLHFLWIPE
jgi:hypothetical protein